MKTKDRILNVSLELFNHSDVVSITTNHIARELKMSPGNLYFHFENKEEIILNIFGLLKKDTYEVWKTSGTGKVAPPIAVIEKNLELIWKYRFIHREIYQLKQRDHQFAVQWADHRTKMEKLMTLTYKRWIKAGWMRPISNSDEISFLVDVLFTTASAFLNSIDSENKGSESWHLQTSQKYILRILSGYTESSMAEEFSKAIQANS